MLEHKVGKSHQDTFAEDLKGTAIEENIDTIKYIKLQLKIVACRED